jgi:hypothetical protein
MGERWGGGLKEGAVRVRPSPAVGERANKAFLCGAFKEVYVLLLSNMVDSIL